MNTGMSEPATDLSGSDVSTSRPFDPETVLAPLVERGSFGGPQRWRLTPGPLWWLVHPADSQLPAQGWKLHISATPRSATAVLERTARILLRRGCAFKVAASAQRVMDLVSRHYDRASAGKFITVYPGTVDDVTDLAAELHEATAGLAGPQILSDRNVRPGSLVHYRYGGFAQRRQLGDNGAYSLMLLNTEGESVPDIRNPWYTPPVGIPDPFQAVATGRASLPSSAGENAAHRNPRPSPRTVILAGRFLVRSAVRLSTKGGVFHATDQLTKEQVIVKQGRAHIDANLFGTDVRDLLRNEGDMLERLAHLGLTPQKIDFITEEGHVFLVQERLEGSSLRLWNLRARSAGGPSWETVVDLATQLTRMLELVHATGVVLRDLTPDNILVAPDGRARLIDLELAALTGIPASGGGTLGYCAPEQISQATDRRNVPDATADLYSLGAVLFLLATGTEPLLAPDLPDDRPAEDRLEGRLASVAGHSLTSRRMAPLILGLMRQEPARRWSLAEVKRYLTDIRSSPDGSFPEIHAPHGPAATPSADADRLVSDGLAYLLDSMRTSDSQQLWPADGFAATTDPSNLYHGSAGLLGVLTQAARTPYASPRLWDAISSAANWTLRYAESEPRRLPGLQFGRSGTVWALLEAGLLLDDTALVTRAQHIALRIPVTGPVPDVAHGTAGSGLTQLHFFQRTGDERFLDRTMECANGVIATCADDRSYPYWTVSPGEVIATGPVVHYGFAHGMAGIGTFLLQAAQVTNETRYLETAIRVGDALTDAAVEAHGGLRWTAGPSDTVPLTNWCSGSSGVGTFLSRLWQATGESAYMRAAGGAAEAVHTDRWGLPASTCHGVAGNAEFLLDMAEATGDDLYAERAQDAVEAILANTALHKGLLLPTDDTRRHVRPYYYTGVGGVLSFLLRLRHGGPRTWLPEPVPAATSNPVRRSARTA